MIDTEIGIISKCHTNQVVGKTIFKPRFRVLHIPFVKGNYDIRRIRFHLPGTEMYIQSDGSALLINEIEDLNQERNIRRIHFDN